MSKNILIISYLAIIVSPMLACIIGVFILFELKSFTTCNFQPLFAAGISGSIVLAAIILKRWYDRQVVINAIRADLNCYSQYFSITLARPPAGRANTSGVVNITPYLATKIFDELVNQIGLVEPQLAAKIIVIYDTIKCFIPAITLYEGIERFNDNALLVNAAARPTFYSKVEDLKSKIDRLIPELV